MDHGRGILIIEFPAQMALDQDMDHAFREQVALHTVGGQGATVGRPRECGWVPNWGVRLWAYKCQRGAKGRWVDQSPGVGSALSEPLTSDAELFLGAVHTLFHSTLQNPSGFYHDMGMRSPVVKSQAPGYWIRKKLNQDLNIRWANSKVHLFSLHRLVC